MALEGTIPAALMCKVSFSASAAVGCSYVPAVPGAWHVWLCAGTRPQASVEALSSQGAQISLEHQGEAGHGRSGVHWGKGRGSEDLGLGRLEQRPK